MAFSTCSLKAPLSDTEIKAVILEHDDMLVRSYEAQRKQHKYVAKTFYERTLSDESIRTHWGKPLTVLMRLLYQCDNIDMAMSYHLATSPLFPKQVDQDAIAVLQYLRKQGKKICLLTSTNRICLKSDFTSLKISETLFDYIQTEDDTAYHKPDLRVFRPLTQWLKMHHINPEESIYLGNHPQDQSLSSQVGFRFLPIDAHPHPFDQQAEEITSFRFSELIE